MGSLKSHFLTEEMDKSSEDGRVLNVSHYAFLRSTEMRGEEKLSIVGGKTNV